MPGHCLIQQQSTRHFVWDHSGHLDNVYSYTESCCHCYVPPYIYISLPIIPKHRDFATDCIHLRLVYDKDPSPGYVLGQFSRHFDKVTDCIVFYMKQRLNIRGAEHKKLGFPVPRNHAVDKYHNSIATVGVWLVFNVCDGCTRMGLFYIYFAVKLMSCKN